MHNCEATNDNFFSPPENKKNKVDLVPEKDDKLTTNHCPGS